MMTFELISGRLRRLLEVSWRHFGGVLEASWAVWRCLGCVLEASWKHNGGSWALLDVQGGSHAESVIGVSFFGGLGAEAIRFGGGEGSVFWRTYQPGHLAATSYKTYKDFKPTRTSGPKMIQTYMAFRTYKPISIEEKSSQPGGPVGAGGFRRSQNCKKQNKWEKRKLSKIWWGAGSMVSIGVF